MLLSFLVKYPAEKKITALTIVGEKSQPRSSTSNVNVQSNSIRPTIICGLSIRCRTSGKTQQQQSSFVETLNDQNKNEQSPINIMEVDESSPVMSDFSCLYLVVYDFQYTKEPTETEKENNLDGNDVSNKRNDTTSSDSYKDYLTNLSMLNETDSPMNDTNMEVASSNSDEIMFLSDVKAYNILKQQMSLYQNLIPGESDEIFLPPPIASTKQHSGPRAVHVDTTETDAAQATSLIMPPDYSFMNGQLGSSPIETSVTNEKSISDHIAELKSNKMMKKLNYSRAVQCITLPEQYKNRKDLEVSDILPTQDGCHVLVVLKSVFDTSNSALIVYSLNFSCKMVKMNEEPVLVRELNNHEKPVEVTLLPQLERLNGTTEFNSSRNSCEGTAVLVCQDGAVRIIELSTLRTVSVARLDGTKFISAVYCNSKLKQFFRKLLNRDVNFWKTRN